MALAKSASECESGDSVHALPRCQLGLGESFKGHILLLFLIWFAASCGFSSIFCLETYSNGSLCCCAWHALVAQALSAWCLLNLLPAPERLQFISTSGLALPFIAIGLLLLLILLPGEMNPFLWCHTGTSFSFSSYGVQFPAVLLGADTPAWMTAPKSSSGKSIKVFGSNTAQEKNQPH